MRRALLTTESFSGGPDVGCLEALRPLRHLEGHLLALFERLETVHLNGGEVDEHVLTVFAGDEPVALFVTKPLDRPAGHWQLPPFVQSSAGRPVRRCREGAAAARTR